MDSKPEEAVVLLLREALCLLCEQLRQSLRHNEMLEQRCAHYDSQIKNTLMARSKGGVPAAQSETMPGQKAAAALCQLLPIPKVQPPGHEAPAQQPPSLPAPQAPKLVLDRSAEAADVDVGPPVSLASVDQVPKSEEVMADEVVCIKAARTRPVEVSRLAREVTTRLLERFPDSDSAFDAFDTNHSGVVSMSEFQAGVEAIQFEGYLEELIAHVPGYSQLSSGRKASVVARDIFHELDHLHGGTGELTRRDFAKLRRGDFSLHRKSHPQSPEHPNRASQEPKASRPSEPRELKSETQREQWDLEQEATRPPLELPLRSRLRSSRSSRSSAGPLRPRARTVSFQSRVSMISGDDDRSDGEESSLSEPTSEMYEPLSAEEVRELQRQFNMVRRRMAAKAGESIDAGSNDPWLGVEADLPSGEEWNTNERSETSSTQRALASIPDLSPFHSIASSSGKKSRQCRSRFATDMSAMSDVHSEVESKGALRGRAATDMSLLTFSSLSSARSTFRKPTLEKQRLAPGLAEGNAPPRRLTLFTNKSRGNSRMSESRVSSQKI